MKLGNNFTRVLSVYLILDKARVKLFPNFTSIPFDKLLLSWVTNYVHKTPFWHCRKSCRGNNCNFTGEIIN